jgi:hypothetical protein
MIRNEDWATLYNRVGGVKRHLDGSKVFDFSFRSVLGLLLLLLLLMNQGPLCRILRWNLVPPTIYPVTNIRP